MKTHVIPHGKTLVLYDGDCGFCTWAVRQLARLDQHARLEPLALQTPGALERYGISRESAAGALHVVRADGKISRAGEALRDIVAELPWLWPAAWFWRLPSFPWLADRAYFLVADNRHRLSRWLGFCEGCRTSERP